ncbi:MAG: hypothetical protein K6V36_06980 [Anaerolineae bacterium]|nr:hypothetical protein [Anaerolineae bacterium]
MIQTVYRLSSLAYWLEAAPGVPRGAVLALHLALGALLALGLVWRSRVWRRHGTPPALRALEVILIALGLGGAVGRLAEVPWLSARVWVGGPAAGFLALLAIEAWLLPDWPVLSDAWRDVWTWQPCSRRLSDGATAVLAATHLVALCAVGRLLGWALWTGPMMLVVLVAARLAGQPRRPEPGPAVLGLGPLAPAYLVGGLEVARRAAVRLGGWAPGLVPLWPVLAVLLGYTLAYQVYGAWPEARRRALWWALAAVLLGGTLAWAAWAYLSLYARGVTGSDPYCYVQMAVDVMRHGSLLHRFPLAALAGRLQIDVLPAMHVGYREPLDALARAATVWPAGHSVLLGLAGRVAGEPAVYLATPLMGLASVALTAWLAMWLFTDLDAPVRMLTGALAALVVATSFEQLRWLLVHMADVSTQLFSSLTILLAWVAARRGRWGWAAAAGVALGLAYWTRHTQLAVLVPALFLLAAGRGATASRERLLKGAVFLMAALVAALPDLGYHQQVFGSALRPESQELELYALRAVPATTASLARAWLAGCELGYLVPFLLGGVLALGRRNRLAAWALALWLLVPWAIQAPYVSLRLRDLLPALPALALLAAYGVVQALAWLSARRRGAASALVLVVAGLLWLRTAGTATIPQSRAFNNFGYLWATQRAELAGLAAVTEEGAAIGCTLNSGAVELYAGREAFRPADWPAQDLERFLRALWSEGRPVYLLDDGEAMSAVIAMVMEYGRLEPAGVLEQIPYFSLDAGSELRDVQLYRLEPG